MRLFPVLAAVAAIAFAAPALAQQVPASPAVAVTEADLEAAGEALEPVLAAMSEQAAVIRADATLSDTDKRTRIEALIADNKAAIDAFTATLSAYVAAQARAEGASEEQAAATAAMFPALLSQQLTQSLLTGEDAE